MSDATQGIDTKRFRALGLWAAILSTICWGGFIYASVITPPEPQGGAAILEYYAANRGIFLLYGWSGTLAALLSAVYVIVFVLLNDRVGAERFVALFFGALGAVWTAAGFLTGGLSATYFLLARAQDAVLAGIDARASLVTLEIAADVYEAPWFFGSFLIYGLAVLWIASDGLRTRFGPRWLHLTGAVGAICGIVWLRPFLPVLTPVFVPGLMLNVVLLSVWAIGYAAFLYRR